MCLGYIWSPTFVGVETFTNSCVQETSSKGCRPTLSAWFPSPLWHSIVLEKRFKKSFSWKKRQNEDLATRSYAGLFSFQFVHEEFYFRVKICHGHNGLETLRCFAAFLRFQRFRGEFLLHTGASRLIQTNKTVRQVWLEIYVLACRLTYQRWRCHVWKHFV